ncbi:MAG: NAD-dependent epimerase/dehydratase family protein [Candidatus Wallbacteria bacterium]|nr:NAD-dependent epimerase/dehydratase family protein [Candidatus Wallbacteria bacterium]
MNVFLTGASGYIGRAVARRLVAAGHRVTALTRSPGAAAAAQEVGAIPFVGEMGEPVSWQAMAWSHDAAVHIAQEHSSDGPAKDALAIETFIKASMVGRSRALIYTSGVWVLGNTPDAPADERASTAGAAQVSAWRSYHETLVLRARSDQLRTVVLRPGIVYGGRGGLVDLFFETARDEGAAAFIGDGSNRWSLVHLEDLAELYVLLLEGQASGVYHAVDSAPMTVRNIATACSQAAGAHGSVRSVPLAEARSSMGAMADALVMDQAVTAPASAALGWSPSRPTFDAAGAFLQWSH